MSSSGAAAGRSLSDCSLLELVYMKTSEGSANLSSFRKKEKHRPSCLHCGTQDTASGHELFFLLLQDYPVIIQIHEIRLSSSAKDILPDFIQGMCQMVHFWFPVKTDVAQILSHSAVRMLEIFCSPPWADVWRSSSSVTLIISK